MDSKTKRVGQEQPSNAAVLLSRSTLTIMEGSTNDFYTICLKTAPTHRVTVTIREPTNQARTSPGTVTFDEGNWTVPQPVRVSALDDTTTELGAVARQDALEALSQIIVLEHSVKSSDYEYGAPTVLFEYTETQEDFEQVGRSECRIRIY